MTEALKDAAATTLVENRSWGIFDYSIEVYEHPVFTFVITFFHSKNVLLKTRDKSKYGKDVLKERKAGLVAELMSNISDHHLRMGVIHVELRSVEKKLK